MWSLVRNETLLEGVQYRCRLQCGEVLNAVYVGMNTFAAEDDLWFTVAEVWKDKLGGIAN